MDRAVLAAYGWTDLQPQCKFLLETKTAKTKQSRDAPASARSRGATAGPDEVRDEVLARLLALNSERAQQEREQQMAAAFLGTQSPSLKKASRSKSQPRTPRNPAEDRAVCSQDAIAIERTRLC